MFSLLWSYQVVDVLSSKGVKLVPFKLNYTVKSVQSILNITMDTDMLVHFDNWQREGYDDDYEAQDQWPVELRRARLIPAVDYIQVILQSKLSCKVVSTFPLGPSYSVSVLNFW